MRSDEKDSLLLGATGNYRLLEPLGVAGATAEVRLAERVEDNKRFAFKLMHPELTGTMKENFKKEMRVLLQLETVEENLGTEHIPRLIECTELQAPETQRLQEEFHAHTPPNFQLPETSQSSKRILATSRLMRKWCMSPHPLF